jgi:catalase
MNDNNNGATTGRGATNSNKTPVTQFEQVAPGELGMIKEIEDLTVQLMKQRYQNAQPLRNVHPKDHGCVSATFTINPDIGAQFRHGIFSFPGRAYKSLIRFSNATAAIENDVSAEGKASSRGIAIKVLDIDGDVLLSGPSGKTQDFLFINLPVFAVANVAEYLELTKVQLAFKDDITPFFAGAPDLPPSKIKTFQIASQIAQTQVANPVDTAYFSGSPFLLGSDQAVKFSIKPRVIQNTPMPAAPTPNYLREALAKTLDENNGKTVVFDFRVQVRNNESFKIEDATDLWPESVSPFVNIATITIEPQNFNTEERMKECTKLVFSPWHASPALQPLGGINRLRRAAYLASSRFRS